jgi:hypothetical protein
VFFSLAWLFWGRQEGSQNMSKMKINGKDYALEDLSASAKETIKSIQFVDEQIQQKRNEWAIADTARMAYAAALKRDVKA